MSEISRCTYHVFLSFRGEDTRRSFTDHLYTALVHLGIQTFRDDEEIERGNNIKDEIEKAILHHSKISIVVFSKNYAASTWCLNELVMILEHKKSSKHIVLPVFYYVDPSQVKNQTGSYAEAFTQHEQNFESETNMVQRWRNALKEVADIGGMVLQDRIFSVRKILCYFWKLKLLFYHFAHQKIFFSGSKTIKCLALDLKGLQKNKAKRTTTTLHFPKHSKSQFLLLNDVDMETQAFAKMKRLKLLQLDNVKFKGDFKDFPKRLRWLRWHGFCMQSFPVAFDINELVVLDMRNSKLKQVWKDRQCLPNLKILNLNHSHSLLKTPTFSGLPSLEKLMLKDCINLVEVDQSIGELKMLTFLNLKDCTSLRHLPRTIGSLISLEELILSGCSRLDDVPRELHNMESLKVLNLDETAIYQSRLGLHWLLLKRNKGLGFSWASLPGSLVNLSLESCKLSNDVMPNDLCNLASLKSLNLSRNPIHYLPESLKNLTKLDELLLTSCTELQMIPKLPVLHNVFACILISGGNSSFQGYRAILPCFFSSTRSVNIFGCEKLTEVEDVFKLEPIENFEAEEISDFNKIRRLFNVDSINRNRLQLYSYLTDSIMLATPQVLQECGITSTFVVGSEVPIGFKHGTNEHRISFFLPTPSHPDEKIHRFSLCIVFSLASDQMLELLPSVHIFNETKMIKQRYRSSFIGIPETNDNTMLWLIHWPVTDCQFEGGDLVSCMVVPIHLSIRKFGVTYESEHNIRNEYGFSQLSTGDEVSTRNIKKDRTKYLLSLESYGNVKVQLCSYIEESKVLYDYSIITTFDPLPFDYSGHYYGHQAGKTEVSISVPGI
ncbi:hypothetical protein V6Z12_D03G193400 [Gossypium hirsutum]